MTIDFTEKDKKNWIEEYKAEDEARSTETKTAAFFQAILQNYLMPVYRRKEINDFLSLDVNAIERFPRLVIRELIQATEIPTTENTPFFIHRYLDDRIKDGSPSEGILSLRDRYRSLSAAEKREFSLLGAPNLEMSKNLFDLTSMARRICGEISFDPANKSWLPIMSESAQRIT